MTIKREIWSRLTAAARTASETAYAPYSGFRVGAAVLTERGEVFSAANVENVSYGLSVCAERNAVFQAAAKGHRNIIALVVYTPTQTATTPCGACRQVLREFGANAEVLCVCDSEHSVSSDMSKLLPHAFGPHNLGARK